MQLNSVQIRSIPTEATIPLRHRILRPNQPVSACYYEQDNEAKHFGVYEISGHMGNGLTSERGESGELGAADELAVSGRVDEKLVSIVTAHPEDYKLFSSFGGGHWRIRGMATDLSAQGKGFGGAVLHALLDWGRSEGVPLFWCNARERAIPFYLKHGFTIESELFEIKGIGAHKLMKIVL